MNRVLNRLQLLTGPWLWAFVAALFVWVAIVLVTGLGGGIQVMSSALSFGSFFVIVAMGQMLVITLGPGNVDLSIPANMTLAATVSMKLMGGANELIVAGLLVVIVCGILVGCFNYGLIRLLRIPPIIATLSASFIFQSIAIWYNRGLRVKPPEWLADFTTSSIGGIPILAMFVMVASVGVHILLTKTVYGRSVLAMGQNAEAAYLAGIATEKVRFATYIVCAVFAALCGYLLAGFSGGAALNMGQEYLLASIAVVVIGGTSVAGGFSNVPGLWGASLFLFLVVSMLNTYGLGAGIRLLLTGVIIIAVISLAGNQLSRTS